MSPAPQPALPGQSPDDLPRMGLLQHLEELRTRILWSLAAVAVTFAPCWIFVEEIYDFLQAPILKLLPEGTKLAFLGVTDPFILYFKVAALAAVFLATPFILYQVWRFVAPGLYRRERLYALPFIFFGSFFFLAGGAFGYYVAFPNAVRFLLEMGQQFMPVITIERYFGFLMTVILGLGVMFEMPILILLLSALGLVTPGFLMRNFRWAVLIIFVIAAIVTPTSDIVNLLIFAIPGILLYLLGVGAAALMTLRRRKAAEAAEGA